MKKGIFGVMQRLGLLAAAGLMAVVCAGAVNGGVVHAGTLTPLYKVNSTADKPDALPGDGVCRTAADNTVCTLRAAVMEANAHPGAEDIELGAHVYKLKLTGDDDAAAVGDLDITSEIAIFGKGTDSTIIDGKKGDRIFEVHSGGKLTLYSVTVRNGATGGTGGGLNVVNGNVTLVQTMFKNNSAAAGGGIAIAAAGAGAMLFSEVDSNIAYAGAGIYNQGSFATEFSSVSDNFANEGGGVWNSGTFNGVSGTIAKNRANINGGGILSAPGSGNQTGLWNMTISDNVADDNNSGDGDGGGINVNSGANVVTNNTIIARNADNSPGAPTPNSKPQDCAGVMVSLGYNLLGNNFGCSGLLNGGKGDKVGSAAHLLNPKLGALGLNGGVTLSYSLLASSPAIDAGDPNDCSYSNQGVIPFDQRQYWRFTDGGSGTPRCDIGSYEYKATSIEDCYGKKPSKPILRDPENKATVSDSQVLLNWDMPRCTFFFKVVVKQDTKKGLKAFGADASQSDITTTPLAKGHTYFWRVSACSTSQLCQKSKWLSFQLE